MSQDHPLIQDGSVQRGGAGLNKHELEQNLRMMALKFVLSF
ncbi:MAG: hypothetical protein RR575_03820 [Acinetobacter sp.]